MKKLAAFLGKHKYLVMSVILGVLVLCLIGVLLHFGKKEEEPAVASAQPSRTATENVSSDTLSGDSKILLVCNGDSNREMIFLMLFDFRVYSEAIVITPLSPDTLADGSSYRAKYAYGGIDMLVSSVESVRQCRIDRYAVIDRSGFSALTDCLGKVTMEVTESYTYESSDKNYRVDTGENELESAMLYTYLKINAEKSDGPARVAGLLCTIINDYLSTVKKEDAQELFGELTNCVNTDITIADYYSCRTDIDYLLDHQTKCTADTGKSP